MPHVNTAIDRQIKTSLGLIDGLETKSVQEFLALVNDMRQRIVLALAESGYLSPLTADMVKQKVAQIIDNYRTRFEQNMSDNQRRLFIKGIQLVDRAIDTANVRKAIPYLSEQTLQQLKNYSAELIKGVSSDVRSRIASQIDLAVMGQKPVQEVIKSIGTNLKSPSVFGTIARRSEIIIRTEANRVQQMATEQRLQQFGKQIDDLQKEWVHAHRGQPRRGHLALHQTVIPYNEKFRLLGEDGEIYLINGPYDPILPAGEVINCGCKSVPVVGRFAKKAAA